MSQASVNADSIEKREKRPCGGGGASGAEAVRGDREAQLWAEAEESRRQLQRVFAGVNDFVGIFDREWRCRHVDHRVAARVGKRAGEVEGEVVWSVFPDLVGSRLEQQMRAAVEDGGPRHFEFYDRSWRRWFDVHVYPGPEGIWMFGSDITERKGAEDALRMSEERLRLAMDAGRFGVWDWDVQKDRLSWTDSLYPIHGVRPEEFGGTRGAFAQLIHPDDRVMVEGAVRKALQGDAGYELEFRVQRPDGEVRWVFTSVRIFRERGRARRMLGITVDVTDRREMERTLRESEQRFRQMADASPFIVWMTDIEGKSVYLNERWYEFTGRVKGRGALPSWLDAIAPGHRPQAEAAFQQANASREGFRVEYPLRRHDGQNRWAITAAHPRLGEHGEFLGFVGSLVDIADRKEVESAAREAALQLRLATEATQVGIWDYNPGTGNVSCDPRCLELYHLPPGDRLVPLDLLLGRVHPEERESVQLRIRDALNGVEDGRFDASFRSLSEEGGGARWLRATGQAFFEADTVVRFIGTIEDITDDKKAEDAMRRLAAIVESSDDAILGKDLQGRITNWNRAAQELYGYTAGEAVGQPVTLLVPEERQAEVFQILERVRRGERVEHFVTERISKAGRRIFVSVTVSPIKDSDGRIVGASKIARDITAQRENDEALRQQTHRLEVLNRVGSTLAAELDLEGLIQTMTDAGRETTGAAFGAFFYLQTAGPEAGSYRLYTVSGVPRSSFEAFAESRVKHLFDSLLEGRSCVRIDDALEASWNATPARSLPMRSYLAVPVVSRSGSVHGGLLFGHPAVKQFDEESERMLIAIAAQASIAIDNANLYRELERELAEHRRAEDALRESEERFRTIADNIAQMAWTADASGEVFWYNKRWYEYTGMQPEEVLGFGWERAVHPDQAERVVAGFRAQMAKGEIWEDTFLLRSGSGEFRWFLARAVPIRESEGAVLRWFGTNTDIHKQRQVELELERARDEALAASRAKDDFLAALSHELRTPLNPVLLIASDAASDPELPEAVRWRFETVRKHVSLEARLIDDLLDLTRIAEGKLQLDLLPQDLHVILQDAVDTVRPELAAKEIRLELRLDARPSTALADAVRLQQVFWNVLKNAAKFTSKGGNVLIQTGRDVAAGEFTVTIRDSGIGLEPGELQDIFDAFSQGSHARTGSGHRFGGLGLGLAIVKRLVGLHGGSIRAESGGKGQGSTFTVRLPFPERLSQRTDGRPRPLPQPEIPPREDREEGAVARILLVDDHASTRMTLKHLLTRRRFEVLTAGTVAEALDLGLRQPVDLLVSDIGLPDGNGYSLIEELRKSRPDLLGIALSGYGMEEDLARSRIAGFARHLTKPIDVAVLDQMIGELLKLKR